MTKWELAQMMGCYDIYDRLNNKLMFYTQSGVKFHTWYGDGTKSDTEIAEEFAAKDYFYRISQLVDKLIVGDL